MANVTLNAGVVYYGGWWGPITDGMLIPPDAVITIEPNWKNNGLQPVTGHLTLKGKYPNGEAFEVECIANQDKTLGPEESSVVTFADIMMGQREGIWPFEISLTIDGVEGGRQNFAFVVSNTLTENQVRIPLEMQKSPLEITLNPTEVYGHVGAYIYRILPLPIEMRVTFHSGGESFVEVIDADNQRWLLTEKTPISRDTVFTIDWDGRGVFEPRVWKDGNVTGITVEFEIPEEEAIKPINALFNPAPIVLGVGLGTGIMIALKRKGVKGVR